MNSQMITCAIVLFVDYVPNMSSRTSCYETLLSKKQWTKQMYMKLHAKMLKILQIPMREKPVLVVTLVVWMKRLWSDFQSEVKVTQETKFHVCPPETRGGTSTVVSRITHRITADTKVRSVVSVTKQVICILNVLTRSPRLSRRKIDNMSVSQKIPRN